MCSGFWIFASCARVPPGFQQKANQSEPNGKSQNEWNNYSVVFGYGAYGASKDGRRLKKTNRR
jgi:hypothetical protein